MARALGLLGAGVVGLALAACAAPERFRTVALQDTRRPDVGYRVERALADPRNVELFLVLSFSGGGTRSGALAYGVLEELARHEVLVHGERKRLLDEVDVIYGVSGGAVPAAYYGAFGDRIFERFVPDFLETDFQWALGQASFSPLGLLELASPTTGRGDILHERLDAALFHGRTYAQMLARPLVVLSAADLNTGARFEFTQNYFDLLCADLDAFSVARAVAASSAVPLVLAPVTIESHAGSCGTRATDALRGALRQRLSPSQALVIEDLLGYDDSARRFIHLADGGLSDNLGLRGLLNVESLGLLTQSAAAARRLGVRRIVLITVNARQDAASDIDTSPDVPGIATVFGSLIDLPLARRSRETQLQMADLVRRFREQAAIDRSAGLEPLDGYAIDVSFTAIEDARSRSTLASLPTTWKLTHDEVDSLRLTARDLLRKSADFQRLMRDIGASP